MVDLDGRGMGGESSRARRGRQLGIGFAQVSLFRTPIDQSESENLPYRAGGKGRFLAYDYDWRLLAFN